MTMRQSLVGYIKSGTRILYAATALMCCAGLILDAAHLHELSRYIVLNNLITVGIIVIMVLLYLAGILNIRISFAVIIYIVFLNILLDFITRPYGSMEVLFYTRNSLFVLLFVTISSLIVGKFHGILITLIYLVSFIIMTLISGSRFLRDTIAFQSLLFAGYTAVIYYFVEAFEKSIHEQAVNTATILEQNETVKEINTLLEERQQKVVEQSMELGQQKEELTKINKELKEVIATRDKFFSIIAHDLKNPLSSIMGFSEMLHKNSQLFDDAKRNKYVKAIYECSVNTYNLLENLLLWSRMQTSGIKIHPEVIHLIGFIQDSSRLLETMRKRKHIDLLLSVDENLQVFTDKYMLSSVINNLLSNAIKFTHPGGTIMVSAVYRDNNMIEICVSDNGVGMLMADADKLFHYEQNQTTRGTANEKGTGLGLLLCKDFVQKNGGRIWVESEYGKGSRFYFSLKNASGVN
jgi:signal transduction histidine kinase